MNHQVLYQKLWKYSGYFELQRLPLQFFFVLSWHFDDLESEDWISICFAIVLALRAWLTSWVKIANNQVFQHIGNWCRICILFSDVSESAETLSRLDINVLLKIDWSFNVVENSLKYVFTTGIRYSKVPIGSLCPCRAINVLQIMRSFSPSQIFMTFDSIYFRHRFQRRPFCFQLPHNILKHNLGAVLENLWEDVGGPSMGWRAWDTSHLTNFLIPHQNRCPPWGTPHLK